MCVYIYIYHIYMNLFKYICNYVYLHKWTSLNMYVCIDVNTSICASTKQADICIMCVYIHLKWECIYVNTCVFMYIFDSANNHVQMYICIDAERYSSYSGKFV